MDAKTGKFARLNGPLKQIASGSLTPLILLVSVTAILGIVFKLLDLEWRLLTLFAVVSFLFMCAYYFSSMVFRKHFDVSTSLAVDASQLKTKEAETQVHLLNGALGAIITAAVAIIGFSYSTSQQQGIDWKAVDLINIESQLPDLDNRLLDLSQTSIFQPKPLNGIYPLFFPKTLRDSNGDIGLMNKVNHYSGQTAFKPAIARYGSFIEMASNYVNKAGQLNDVSDRSQQSYSPEKQSSLKKELAQIQDLMRESFFSFREAYCSFMSSPALNELKNTIQASRGTAFVFRSNFCRGSRATNPNSSNNDAILWWKLK